MFASLTFVGHHVEAHVMRFISINNTPLRSPNLCALVELQWAKETDPVVRESMLQRDVEGDSIQRGRNISVNDVSVNVQMV